MRSAFGAAMVEGRLLAALFLAMFLRRPVPPMQFRRTSLIGIGLLVIVDVLVSMVVTDTNWAIGYAAAASITLIAAVFILIRVGIPTRDLAVVGESVIVLIASWAIFYRVADLVTPHGFGGRMSDAVEALYFSSVIASTLGLSDLLPQTAFVKVLVILQLFAMGAVLLVVGAVIARRVAATNGDE